MPFTVDIGHVPVFIGALLGAMLVFLFSSFAIKAVGRAAQTVIEEVRRQFKDDPGIMAGHVRSGLRHLRGHRDRIGALKAMVLPGLWRSRVRLRWG